MPQQLKKHRIRHLVRAVTSTPWAIEPTKLEEIRELLELRSRGETLTAEEVRARLGDSQDDAEGPRLVGRVAVLPLCGVLAPRMNLMMEISGGTSTQQFGQWFTEAAADPNVSAIVFDVDSPGGNALGLQELVDQIAAVRQQHDKPVVAVATGLCASAAYFVASVADELVATASSMVGSIGTLLIHSETSQQDAERGVKFTTFAAGRHKADGDSHQPLTAQAKATLQERVDDYYGQFVAAVAANRGVSPETVQKDYGQGKAWIASRALAAGMIDRIATLEQVVSELNAAAPSPPPPKPSFTPSGGSTVNKKIKAALYAREIIDSMDVEDTLAQVALKALFAGHGQATPKTDEEILAALAKGFAPAAAAPTKVLPVQESVDLDKVRSEAAAGERIRQSEIRAAGDILGISAELVTAAVESSKPIAAIRDEWMAAKAKEKQSKPVEKTDVTPVAAGYDTFAAGAVLVLCERAGFPAASGANAPAAPIAAAARELRNERFSTIATESLRMQGQKVRGTNEEVAAAWLKMHGEYIPSAQDGGNFQRASDFPNLLSNLMGKVLDQAIELAEASYPFWTARLPDVADLKPKSIVAIGQLDQLDRLEDDGDPQPLKFDEEAPGWIQIDRFGNKIGLTPVMVANDDLDSFAQGLTSLAHAHEMTLNRLCLSLLTGNVTLLDTYALFDDTNHLNDLTTGGTGPTADAASLMRKKHRMQTGVGGKGYVRTPPKIALVPTNWETTAEQSFLPLAGLPENKLPVSDATLNTFRGKIIPIVEPELDANSIYFWYTFADPRLRRTIVHAFQSGYGRFGKRSSWWDPATETRYTRLEGRFAAAVAGFRGAVRNKGQA